MQNRQKMHLLPSCCRFCIASCPILGTAAFVKSTDYIHPSMWHPREIIKSDRDGDGGSYLFFSFLFNACMRAQCRKSIHLGSVMIKFQLTVCCDPSWRKGSLVWFFVLSEDALQIWCDFLREEVRWKKSIVNTHRWTPRLGLCPTRMEPMGWAGGPCPSTHPLPRTGLGHPRVGESTRMRSDANHNWERASPRLGGWA